MVKIKDMCPEKTPNVKKDFLRTALSKCLETLESKSGSIFLFDDSRNELVLKAIDGNGTQRSLIGLRQSLDKGIAGFVASQRKPLLVADITKHHLQNRQQFKHYDTNSFLSAPLVSENRLIGVININQKSSQEPFTPQDLKLLSVISGYIAMTINNSEAVKGLKETLNSQGNGEEDRLNKFASLGKLAAGIAHELNNPLDGTIRYINLSLGCLAEEGIVREYLLESKKGLNRMVKIIRSLLDFTHSHSLPPKLMDINKVINDSLDMIRHHIVSNDIKVEKELGSNLPLVKDKGLKLVFSNLLKNSCEVLPRGGKIKITSRVNNGFIETRFSDNGPGIPTEVQDKIFEPFFTTKEMGKGSGLGLAICCSIMQRYGGRIVLEKKNEKGAAFIIRLPIPVPIKDNQTKDK